MATISANRRPIRDDAERKNEFTCRISPNSLCASRNNRFAKKSAESENGPAPGACRDRGANSNACIVRPMAHSVFIAAIEPATVEIFSDENPPRRPMRRSGSPTPAQI
jgi:hypothetical protein